jgi:hypothetical protein
MDSRDNGAAGPVPLLAVRNVDWKHGDRIIHWNELSFILQWRHGPIARSLGRSSVPRQWARGKTVLNFGTLVGGVQRPGDMVPSRETLGGAVPRDDGLARKRCCRPVP